MDLDIVANGDDCAGCDYCYVEPVSFQFHHLKFIYLNIKSSCILIAGVN